MWAAAVPPLLLAAAAGGEPGWRVGWGFVSHRNGSAGSGFPPLPQPWRSWRMQDAGVGYFLGNASGMESGAELAAEDRFGIVGLGWQLNNIPSHYSHVEQFEVEEAKRLKALRPDVKVMVTRETEVTTVFYDMSNKTMFDPATQDYWTQCGGKPCQGSWDSPAGNTPKYFFNFSNPRAADWWVNEFVGTAVKNPLFDGVYFDCSCGSPPGDGLDQQQMQADAQVAFDRALKLIADAGKWASAWNNDGAISQGNCEAQMRKWMSIGADDTHTLQVIAPSFRNSKPGEMTQAGNNTIAAFLISRGPSATLMFPVLGAYGAAVHYGWSPLLDTDFGTPLAPGGEGPSGVFTRHYSKATVTLDCAKWAAGFGPATPLPAPTPAPPAPPPAPYDVRAGTDLGGDDLGQGCPGRPGCSFPGTPVILQTGDTYAACHDLCASTAGCRTWAFKPAACADGGLEPAEHPDALCWLKSGSVHSSANPCRTSGSL